MDRELDRCTGQALSAARVRVDGYVDKILKGTKPTDVPVEQATKLEFIINFKASKQIGLKSPANVLHGPTR